MKIKKLGILKVATKVATVAAVALPALFLSIGANASPSGASASHYGPNRDGDGGNCYYAYSIIKYGPQQAFPGDEIKYRVAVTNIGDCDLRHVDVTDVLPEGTEFVQADPPPTYQKDEKLRWEDVRLEENERQYFVIRAKVKDWLFNTTITNTACAFTPYIGIRICSSASTWIYGDDDDRH